MPKIRRIYKSGNSLVISIPREYLEALDLDKDDNVQVQLAIAGHHLVKIHTSTIYLTKHPPISS